MVLNGLALHGSHKQDSVCYGVKSLQNCRKELEDAYSAHIGLVHTAAIGPGSATRWSEPGAGASDSCSSLSFFGVFDGHGGSEAAQHAAARLHQNFSAALMRQQLESTSTGSEDSLVSQSSAGANADAVLAEAWSEHSTPDSDADLIAELGTDSPTAASGSCWASSVRAMAPLNDRYSQNVRRALQNAFIQTDAELAGTEVGEVVGTTAVVAVVGRSEVFVAHCGDSRAVLCRKGVAIPLTSDHKPDRRDEMARVASLGGKVTFKGGSHRVMGLLAMTRAIGDHFLRPYIIPDPEVASLQRTHDDELLLLASDGLWDVFNCQEATTLALRSTMRARERGASASAACRVGASVLARGAIERGSKDNITVLVIDLRRHESAGSIAAVLAAQCSDAPFAFPPYSRRKRSSSSSGADDDGNSSSGGAAAGNWSSRQQHPHQAPRQSHLEALASTWAAAAAAFGKPQRSSSSPGGPVTGSKGSPAAAAAAARAPSSSSSAAVSRSSAPGGCSSGGNSGGNAAGLVVAATQASSQQQLQHCMQSVPLSQHSSTTAATAGAASKPIAAPPAALPAAAKARSSHSTMRSCSFSGYELNQRGLRAPSDFMTDRPSSSSSSSSNSSSSEARSTVQQAAALASSTTAAAPVSTQATVQATPVAAGPMQARQGIPAAAAAAGVFPGSSCCSADKPPLPPSAHVSPR